MFQKVIIIGAGLIGSSIGRGLKAAQLANEISFIEENHAVHEIIRNQGFGIVTEVEIKNAECVILAIPVLGIPKLLSKLRTVFSPNTLVMDTGSVKEDIVEAAYGIQGFVGAHPLAGKEITGFVAGESSLFKNRSVILTPVGATKPKALMQAHALWEALDANVYEMNPETHDLCFAKYSHLTNLLSFVLMAQHGKVPQLPNNLFPPSFIEMTRLAASDPIMWRDICFANREPILQSLDAFEKTFIRLKLLIESQDFEGLRQFFERHNQLKKEED